MLYLISEIQAFLGNSFPTYVELIDLRVFAVDKYRFKVNNKAITATLVSMIKLSVSLTLNGYLSLGTPSLREQPQAQQLGY